MESKVELDDELKLSLDMLANKIAEKTYQHGFLQK